MFDTQDKIVRKDIQSALQVSQATAILLLREMLDKGILERVGTGRYSYYCLKQKPGK